MYRLERHFISRKQVRCSKMNLVKKFIVIILCFKLCKCYRDFKSLKISTGKFNSDLPKAICYVVNKILIKFETFELISAVENEDDADFNDLKTDILKCKTENMTVRLDTHYQIEKVKDSKKVYNVILLDKFTTFRVLNMRISNETFEYRGYYLFVFINGNFKEFENIKSILYKRMMVRSSFLYENNQTKSIIFERLSMYENGYCGGSKSSKIVEFKNGKFSTEKFEVFIENFNNLHGCELIIPTFNRPPSLIIDKRTGKLSGFDWTILNILAKKLNFTIQEKRINGEFKWGSLNAKSQRFSDALREVYEGSAHFVIGNYFLRANRIDFFDMSISYYVSPIVATIPLGRKYTSFEKLLRPFDVTIWMLLLAMFIISLFIIFMINLKCRNFKDVLYGKKVRSPVMNILTAVVGGSQPRLPKRNFPRFVLMMFLIFCLIQRNAYQSLMFLFMTTTQRHPEISSLEEMIKNNFTIYSFPSYYNLIGYIKYDFSISIDDFF